MSKKLVGSIDVLIKISFILLLTACNLPVQLPRPDIVDNTGNAEVPLLHVDADRDSCLDGTWVMNTVDVDLLIASMVPVPNIRVPSGTLTMTFVDGTFTYRGDLVLRIDLDPTEDKYLEGDGSFVTGGAYATKEDTTLILDITASETQIFNWTAHKNGESYTAEGIGPTIMINPPGEAPYRCSADSLEIDTRGATSGLTMFFHR